MTNKILHLKQIRGRKKSWFLNKLIILYVYDYVILVDGKKIEPYLNNFNLKGVALNVLFDVLMFFFSVYLHRRIK